MSRILAAVLVLLSAGAAAGCGGSRHTAAIVTEPLPNPGQAWVRRVSRNAGETFGDAHAKVSRFENVELAASGKHADVLELRGHFQSHRECFPGSKARCSSVYHFRNVQAVVNARTHRMIVFGNDGSDAELAAFARARRASPLFRSFPDLADLVIDCDVPSALVSGGAPGTCTTWARQLGATTRVLFIARWPLSKPSGTRRVGGWAVTVSRNGHVLAVHRHRYTPPQSWR